MLKLRLQPLGLVFVGPTFLLVALAATCAAPSPPTTVAPPPDRPVRSTPALATPSTSPPLPVASPPAASASASASASARVPAASARAPLPVYSATPGKIECGEDLCDLKTQFCCGGDKAGYCDARTGPSPLIPCLPVLDQHRCDESADCPQNQHCCETESLDKECMPLTRWVCTAKPCGQSLTATKEVCLAGAQCAGGPCAVVKDERYGYCPPAPSGRACGSATCHAGEACCWNKQTRTGSCVAGDRCPPAGDTTRRFECQRPSDCGSGYDCFNNTGTHADQDFHCGHISCNPLIILVGPVLCETLRDCPPLPYVGPKGEIKARAPVGCTQYADAPPGVKGCDYR